MGISPLEGALLLIKANPTLLDEVVGDQSEVLTQTKNRPFEGHACLPCGELAVVAIVAGTSIGPRWLDVCMKDYGALMAMDKSWGSPQGWF